jgi:hypothetical protein
MATVFFFLRNYIVSDILLNITSSTLNDINQIFIPKELLAGFLSAVIRLFLKGLIEDTTIEMPILYGTSQVPKPKILEPNLLKGSDEPSEGPSGSYEPSDSGEASDSGKASGSGVASGSGEASGSGVASGDGKKGVITYSDYGYSSSEEEADFRSDQNDEYTSPINQLIYSPNDKLSGQSKETLEEVKKTIGLMKAEYKLSNVPAAQQALLHLENKVEACDKELEKLAYEEKNSLTDNEGKEKELEDKGKGKEKESDYKGKGKEKAN